LHACNLKILGDVRLLPYKYIVRRISLLEKLPHRGSRASLLSRANNLSKNLVVNGSETLKALAVRSPFSQLDISPSKTPAKK